MIIISTACTLFAISLVSVIGAPGASKGSLQHSPSCRGEPIDKLYQTFRRQELPRLSEHPTAIELNAVWKDNKKKGDIYFATTNALLQDAASGRVKPDALQRSLSSNRGDLEAFHAQMLGWQTYYRTFKGCQFDPERRRLQSAFQRGTMAKTWHDETDFLLKSSSQHWQKIQDSIPLRLDGLQTLYKEASDDMKATYRTKYSAFVDHLLGGGHFRDIPFVSSRQAKQLQARRISSESQ
jgi:hypothetical protein